MKRVASAESLALVGHYRNALEQDGIACIVKNELLAELRTPAVAGPPWRCTQCHEDNDAGFAACWSCGAVDEAAC